MFAYSVQAWSKTRMAVAYSSLLPKCSPACMTEFPDCCFLQLGLLFLWKMPSRHVLFAVGNLTSVVGHGVTESLRLAGTSRHFLVQPAGLEAVSPFLQPVEVPPYGWATVWCSSHFSQFCIISKLAESVPLPSRQSSCFCCGWDFYLCFLSWPDRYVPNYWEIQKLLLCAWWIWSLRCIWHNFVPKNVMLIFVTC